MCLLLAEDGTELANWLVRALQQGGFQVDWVNDGRMVRVSLKATRYARWCSTTATTFDLMLLSSLGVTGYLLRKQGVPMAPLILGFVLGAVLKVTVPPFMRALARRKTAAR